MSFTMNFWRVSSGSLQTIPTVSLDSEKRLEDWISKDPTILGIDVLIIGRQVRTDFGGVIDLLALNSSGDCVIIELKRDKSPRDLVAQILDYASWIRKLQYIRLEQISQAYNNGKSLATSFNDHFGIALPENINSSHSMIVVSAQLDDSSERIIEYLAEEYKVNINAIFFQFYKDAGQEYLARAWFMDPEEVQDSSETRKQAPWSGYWFVNVGEGIHRNWEDNVQYGFIGAGQGTKYSRPLTRLKPDDKIFAYMKGEGYVGYGVVQEPAKRISDFILHADGKPLLEHKMKAPNPKDNIEDPDKCEWLVPIRWIKTYSRQDARHFKGLFANQNIVCKLRDEQTVGFLEKEFEIT